MKIIFGGVRGSFPTAGPEVVRYGGSTTALLIAGADGTRVLADLGSGTRRLDRWLPVTPGGELTVLLSHYHLDHLIGLPVLPQLYRREWALEFASPAHGGIGVRQALSGFMTRPYWPIPLEELASRRMYLDLPGRSDAPLRRGGLEIRWVPSPHEGGSTMYRFDEPATGASFVFATDIEWPAATEQGRRDLVGLLRNPSPAQALAMDGHYTPGEYPAHKGWGHSSWAHVAEAVARAAWGRAGSSTTTPPAATMPSTPLRTPSAPPTPPCAWPGREWC
jgi:phosphoribosyl 1,2-cyclic phosphodiesterase